MMTFNSFNQLAEGQAEFTDMSVFNALPKYASKEVFEAVRNFDRDVLLGFDKYASKDKTGAFGKAFGDVRWALDDLILAAKGVSDE